MTAVSFSLMFLLSSFRDCGGLDYTLESYILSEILRQGDSVAKSACYTSEDPCLVANTHVTAASNSSARPSSGFHSHAHTQGQMRLLFSFVFVFVLNLGRYGKNLK